MLLHVLTVILYAFSPEIVAHLHIAFSDQFLSRLSYDSADYAVVRCKFCVLILNKCEIYYIQCPYVRLL